MSAPDSRAWLAHLEQFGIKLGLDTIVTLMDAVGHPERTCPVLHIAGTNGKGSVSAMVAHALSTSGLVTARYTSPHLVRLEERFAVDGRSVATRSLDAALDEVWRVVGHLQSAGTLTVEPTYFEATTAAAFLLFRAAGADVAVIEVGLGGRYDATNIVAPLVVQATFVAASAVLTEAALSFLGVGVPAQTPSWGNMMAEGRNFVAVAFHIILYPGLLLAATVLAINMMGDGLRDALDPRLARRV